MYVYLYHLSCEVVSNARHPDLEDRRALDADRDLGTHRVREDDDGDVVEARSRIFFDEVTPRRIHHPLHRRSVPSAAVVLLGVVDIGGFEEGSMGVEVVLVHVVGELWLGYMAAFAEDNLGCSLRD